MKHGAITPHARKTASLIRSFGELNKALHWKGPSALAKSGQLTLLPADNWLNADQSELR